MKDLVRFDIRLGLALSLILAASLYWPGLAGPILFDDYWNLAPVSRWHSGQQGFLSTLLPNQDSVVFSRPVAMASFMLTTWIGGGADSFPLKLGNLVVHLMCGLAGWWLLRALLRKDKHLAPYADCLAVAMTAIWLIHPLHVSTVLYAVQRMAQLSTFFTLLAVSAYVVGREDMAAGRDLRARVIILVCVPLLTLAGVLSKQNAAITPFLCLVVELAYYKDVGRNKKLLATFYGMGVALPIIAAACILLIAPHRLLAGFDDLEFSLLERLMTQPRALLDYVGMWFLPRGSEMGLYTDDFPISTSLLIPATTLPAFIFLLTMSIAAFRARARFPSLFAGWFFFLVGHGIESSFLPLEMYYEHRNYLPAFGLLLITATIAAVAISYANAHNVNPKRILVFSSLALGATLSFSTLARVLVWQSEDAMTVQGMKHHPNSIRVHLDRTSLALRSNDYVGAMDALLRLTSSPHARQRLIGNMDLVAIRCMMGESAEDDLYKATRDAQSKLTVNEVHVALLQEAITRNGACTSVAPEIFANSLVMLLDAATDQPESAPNKSTIRRLAGQLYARSGRWGLAEQQAKIGWDGVQTMPLGSLLVRSYAMNGRPDSAEAILIIMESKLRTFDNLWQYELEQLREIVRQAHDRVSSPDKTM